jgi:hypothetical protein
MKKSPADIDIADRIILEDGKTIVRVIDTKLLVGGFVRVSWLEGDYPRAFVYSPNDQVEVSE